VSRGSLVLTGEGQENVGSHRDIGKVLEGAEPADWYQNQGSDVNVQSFIVTVLVKGFKADNLVHLLTDKN